MAVVASSAFAGTPIGLLVVAAVCLLGAFLAWGARYIYRTRQEGQPAVRSNEQLVSDGFVRGRAALFWPLLAAGIAAAAAGLLLALTRAV